MVALGIMVVVGASDFTYPERYSKTSGYETVVCRTAEAIGSLASSKLAVPMHMKITIPPPKDLGYTKRSSIISCWWLNTDVYPPDQSGGSGINNSS